jgi:ferredoxin/flavodoxin---NADP+ reductase
MTFTITQSCCKDASCVEACPVNCIHPSPGEPEFADAAMLYIDDRACIDCGACADACPVDAAVPAGSLRGPARAYVDINKAFYADRPAAGAVGPPGDAATGPLFHEWGSARFDWSLPSDFAGLDVAVVGTGPAGMYVAELLLLHTTSRVTLIDRLPVAGGLLRHGVAPDHLTTRGISRRFARLYSHPRVRVQLGVEVGTDVTPAELGRSYDAVVYAVGASAGRSLGVPGEQLPGVHSAPEFVGWYNGHPDLAADAITWDGERAVVVGTGNVALDIARILTRDPDELSATDIAQHALQRLRDRPVREVTALGRRGPADAAWTSPELLELTHLPDVEVVVDTADPRTAEEIAAGGKAGLLRDLPSRPDASRRVTLRFHSTVAEVLGAGRVAGVRLTDGSELPADLVATAVGFHGRELPGLPYDPTTGTPPHHAGSIDGVPGAYVVGWFKRGSTGGIGDNRLDAEQTVRTLLDDAVAGRLPRRRRSPLRFARRPAAGV